MNLTLKFALAAVSTILAFGVFFGIRSLRVAYQQGWGLQKLDGNRDLNRYDAPILYWTVMLIVTVGLLMEIGALIVFASALVGYFPTFEYL